MDKKWIKIVREYGIITFGLFVVALGIHLFMVPNLFVAGGISGLAIVVERSLINLPEEYQYIKQYLSVGNIMLLINIILFVVGFIFIGSDFGIRTIFSSLVLSLMVSLLEKIYPIVPGEPLMEDAFIQLIIASIMSAIGLSIAFKYRASTGGTDITGKILNKYFHINLGKAVLLSDLLITLSAFTLSFSAFVYGLFGIILNGIMIDYFLNKFNERKEIVIISEQCDEIKNYIINVLEKGATIYIAKGAYTNQEKEVIRTVVNNKELITLKLYLKTVDPNAFITVNVIHETYGLGFMAVTD